MWPNIRKHTAPFASAVLTGLDAEGYPFSVRCIPTFDDNEQVLRIAPAAGEHVTAGQASLLFHSHNDQLWDLQIVQVLGTLEARGEAWAFRPERLLGDGGSAWKAIQMIVGARRTTRRYLAKRGLARPRIPWDRIRSLYPPKTQATAAKPGIAAQTKH